MNGEDTQNEGIEKLLGKARLSGPSPLLKERVITEAKKAWNPASIEMPWWIPVRRLVASVAAAVVVIWLANLSSDCSVARWQAGRGSATIQPSSESDVLPELPYSPFVRHLALSSREWPATDASGWRGYMETVRLLLNEARKNEMSETPAPPEERSRLLPDQSILSSYS
jgi:hypothetical protein